MTFCRAMLLFLAALVLTVFHGGHRAHALDPRFELNPQALQQKLPAKTPTTASPAKLWFPSMSTTRPGVRPT